MQTSSDLSTAITSAPSPSPGRRLLSKFASGLGSKSRSLPEFHIELNEAHKQYSNGDTITGSVRVKVQKPVRITHIVVSLTGHAHVYKNPASPGDIPRAPAVQTTGRGKTSTGQYHGNGFATLFEDESILCGDGRLAEGSYQFNFELEFPKKALPSSIDFERGRISYLITATLTRPTTMNPVLTFDRTVNFLERIDISSLATPKPRTVTLDAVSKRSKAKAQALKLIDQPDRKSHYIHTTTSVEGLPNTTYPPPSTSSIEVDRPLSPVPSELSGDSHVSSTGIHSQNGSIAVSPTVSVTPRQSSGKSSGKAISTIIAPHAGGCLRGDHLTVKIVVNHNKYMRSMSGVIVTLYRHARVDTQPSLPIGPLNSRTSNAEGSLSKSSTGLSGLSFSGAGPAHVFRKDMAQVVLPLVINPSTLTADIVAKLRVPEEAFPTIVGVPGAMISFRYHIEVIIDIQGRLSGPDRGLSTVGEFTGVNGGASDQSDVDWSATTNYGTRILDTSYIRRDKGLVCIPFEIVIGTVDSERRKGKKKVEVVPEPPTNGHVDHAQQTNVSPDPPAFDSIRSTPAYQAQQNVLGRSITPAHDGRHTNGYAGYDMPIPLPQMPDESQMSEKERIRLAETRLLPSQPPGLDDQDATTGMQEASAPRLDDDLTPTLNGPLPQHQYATPGPSSSAYAVSESPQRISTAQQVVTNGHLAASDDKQELERARLEAQASAPPEVDAETGAATHASAPVMPYGTSHSDVHDSHAEASGSADLPRYER